MNACTTTSGDSATIAASHLRRPASRAVLQVTTSMPAASSSAVTVKYAWTTGTSGSSSTNRVASHADTPMNAPVSTGYSTGWSA